MKLSDSNLSLSVMLMGASFAYLTSVAMDQDLIPFVEAPAPSDQQAVAAVSPETFAPIAPLHLHTIRRQLVSPPTDPALTPPALTPPALTPPALTPDDRAADDVTVPERASNPWKELAALDAAPTPSLKSDGIVPKPKPRWFAETEPTPSVLTQTAAILPHAKPAIKPAAKSAVLPNTTAQDTTDQKVQLASLHPDQPPVVKQHRKPRVTWNWRLAYLDYCDRNPNDCGVFEKAPLIDWSSEKKQLNSSWENVWENFWPTPDQVGDTWGIGSDCEDYALSLRAELVKEGFPRYHLLMATGRALDGTNKKHAVLILRTTDGWKVADGNYPHLLNDKTASRVFSCESLEDPNVGNWVKCPGLNKSHPDVYVGF